MSCTKEEIEIKRLAALQRFQANKLKNSPKMFNYNGSSTISKCNGISSHNCITENSAITGAVNATISKGLYNSSKRNQSKGLKDVNHIRMQITKPSSSPYLKPKAHSEKNELCSKIVSAAICMVTESRFEVKPSEYSEQLISVFKTISSKSYDPNTHLWSFLVEDYEELQEKVLNLHPHVVLGAIPQYVLKVLKEPAVDSSTVDLTLIEPFLRSKLMDFQRDGVRFAIKKKGRCLIADDMGLGKTFQALAIADYYKDDWPLLIATTSSMRGTWQEKVHELLLNVPVPCVVNLSSGKDCQYVTEAHTKVVISSYKMITTATQLLKDKKFGVVILDESHLLKSHKAQCTIALNSITKKAKRVILLSGTPALSRPKELYTQLALIQPGFFGGFTEFGKRYCAGKLTNFGWDMNGESNLAELQIILQKIFLIRRTKEQVLTNLQGKTREIVVLDPSLLKISQEKQNSLTEIAETYVNKKRANEKQAALIVFFKETALLKMKAICKYIDELIKDKLVGKFLVFAHHKEVINSICCTLDQSRIQYICIDGATKVEHRTTLIERFQFNESCRVAVLSITAASAGITLTAANLVLFAELHWNPGTLIQAESRAHRIGQEDSVSIRYLLAKGTADDFMWPKLQKKLDILNEVGLSKDTFQDTILSNQANPNTIEKYMDCSFSNKDSFIPGTNIRQADLSSIHTAKKKQCLENSMNLTNVSNIFDDDMEKTFLEDKEGDDLLAELEF